MGLHEIPNMIWYTKYGLLYVYGIFWQIFNLCIYIVGDKDSRIQIDRLRAMPGVWTSKSTNRVSSGKYKRPYASAERLQCPRTPRMPTCPREVENQGWKPTDANWGRGGRFATKLGRKEEGRIKHPSPPHLMLYTHLAGRINKEMTYE